MEAVSVVARNKARSETCVMSSYLSRSAVFQSARRLEWWRLLRAWRLLRGWTTTSGGSKGRGDGDERDKDQTTHGIE